MLDLVRRKCLEAILDSDRDNANRIIDEWVLKHGYSDVLKDVLDPILVELGNLWTMQNDVSFAQVYVSAKIAEDIILKVLDNTQVKVSKDLQYKVIIGNSEDDFHSLGRRLVTTFLTTSDIDVIDLGNDITAKEFVDCAIENKAHLIMVSAMMYTTAQNIKKVRQEIDKRGYQGKILLAVGGAIFNLRPGLWKDVGADGTSRNAVEASGLVKGLLDNIKEGDSFE